MAGCAYAPGKVTGGGHIEDWHDGSKANFGFNADSCNVYEHCKDHYLGVKGQFNYHDMDAEAPFGPSWGEQGVKMQGEVIGVVQCTGNFDKCEDCYKHIPFENYAYKLKVLYRSTNPFTVGAPGIADVCVRDFGEGEGAEHPDLLDIYVTDGPFEGYENKGAVQGNIQAHKCPPRGN
jgi:hypothetical protein